MSLFRSSLLWVTAGSAVLAMTGCHGDDETSSASAAATSSEALSPLDCDQLGSFPEAAMLGFGDGTYVRAGAPTAGGLASFTLGPLIDIPGWAGKNATYTRDLTAPCLDFVAIGDGSGLQENRPLPTTRTACTGQTGSITVIMDNPAIGPVVSFEDASGLPFGKETYFITASQLDVHGRVAAVCLAHPGTGDRFLMARKDAR